MEYSALWNEVYDSVKRGMWPVKLENGLWNWVLILLVIILPFKWSYNPFHRAVPYISFHRSSPLLYRPYTPFSVMTVYTDKILSNILQLQTKNPTKQRNRAKPFKRILVMLPAMTTLKKLLYHQWFSIRLCPMNSPTGYFCRNQSLYQTPYKIC